MFYLVLLNFFILRYRYKIFQVFTVRVVTVALRWSISLIKIVAVVCVVIPKTRLRNVSISCFYTSYDLNKTSVKENAG